MIAQSTVCLAARCPSPKIHQTQSGPGSTPTCARLVPAESCRGSASTVLRGCASTYSFRAVCADNSIAVSLREFQIHILKKHTLADCIPKLLTAIIIYLIYTYLNQGAKVRILCDIGKSHFPQPLPAKRKSGPTGSPFNINYLLLFISRCVLRNSRVGQCNLVSRNWIQILTSIKRTHVVE